MKNDFLPYWLAAKRATFSCLLALLIFSSAASAQNRESASKISPIISYLLFSDTRGGETMPLGDASRFLIQTTFGPTYNDIVNLSNSSFDGWLNTQMSMPITKTVDYLESNNWVRNVEDNLIIAGTADASLLNVMLTAPDQLRQRMAYALSQIFVVSRDVSNGISERPLFYLDYYDMLLENGFGNYRDLLEEVTKNDVMGFYLSMRLNAPANTQVGGLLHPANFYVTSPDENYAREVMQLFSVGLVKLNIDGTPVIENGKTVDSYTQETVENFARVFTGWNIQKTPPETSAFFSFGIPKNTLPMVAFDEFHDKGSKILLNGAVLPANQTAEKDLDDALDNIFNHPNVGPFISKLLIQHFVTSNPTPAYVERVARIFNNNGNDVRGDLKAVVKTILLDEEARNGHKTLPATFGKFKEPYIRQLALWRGLNARRKTNNDNRLDTYDTNFLNDFKQFPLKARSVFNFYQADFSPAGPILDANLVAPVSQLIDSASIVNMARTHEEYIQRHHDDATNSFASDPVRLLFDTQPLQLLVPDDLKEPEDLIERLNIILLGGAMTDEMRQILLDVHDPSLYLVDDKWEVVIDLANIIMLSPQFMIQR